MKQYLDLVAHVNNTGNKRGDRTGTGTTSVFGTQTRYNLKESFPLVTAKFTPFRLVAVELLWLLSGDTNIKYLLDNECHIWDEWADRHGRLGPVYGAQWRKWKHHEITDNRGGFTWHFNSDRSVHTYRDSTVIETVVDQIQEVIDELNTNPESRRLLVSAWNPGVLPDLGIAPNENPAKGKQALPPCHTMFQFYVANGELSCQLYQRSADLFLGVPFNIASYSLLTHMIASLCNLEVGEFIHTIGDAHIYDNHQVQVQELLTREPLTGPVLNTNKFNGIKSIDDFTLDDFEIINYKYHPSIKAPVAV